MDKKEIRDRIYQISMSLKFLNSIEDKESKIYRIAVETITKAVEDLRKDIHK